MFNFSSGSFGACPIFDDLVSRNRLVVERNRLTMANYIVCRVLLTVKCSSSVSGHSVHFQFFALLCATTQHSYCRHACVRHPSLSVCRPSTSFSWIPCNELTSNFGDRYLSTISPGHFFQFYFFFIFYHFFR